jgi:hypothetical protein
MNNNIHMTRNTGFSAQFRLFSLSVILAGTSLVAGCASDNSRVDAANAQSAGDKGEWALSTSLSEKAYAEHPDVLNEFNLATGYENTGQNAKATALYKDLVVKGSNTELTPSRNDSGAPVSASDGNLSDESARRIDLIAGRPSAVVANPEMNRP